jgi:hypothetical protein
LIDERRHKRLSPVNTLYRRLKFTEQIRFPAGTIAKNGLDVIVHHHKTSASAITISWSSSYFHIFPHMSISCNLFFKLVF